MKAAKKFEMSESAFAKVAADLGYELLTNTALVELKRKATMLDKLVDAMRTAVQVGVRGTTKKMQDEIVECMGELVEMRKAITNISNAQRDLFARLISLEQKR